MRSIPMVSIIYMVVKSVDYLTHSWTTSLLKPYQRWHDVISGNISYPVVSLKFCCLLRLIQRCSHFRNLHLMFVSCHSESAFFTLGALIVCDYNLNRVTEIQIPQVFIWLYPPHLCCQKLSFSVQSAIKYMWHSYNLYYWSSFNCLLLDAYILTLELSELNCLLPYMILFWITLYYKG